MTARSRLRSLTWSLLIAVGCSGGGNCGSSSGCGGCGGSGCAAITNFPVAQREPESISIKVSQGGLTALNPLVQQLIGQVLPASGGSINIPAIGPETIPIISGVLNADVYICQSPAAGQCTATFKVDGMTIAPTENMDGSVTIAITLTVELDTTDLPVSISASIPGIGSACGLMCDMQFETSQSTPPSIPIVADVDLTIDQQYGNILAFNVDVPNFTSSISPNDLLVSSSGTSCGAGLLNFTCSVLDNSTVKQLLLSSLSGTITSELTAQVDNYRCLKCAATSDCPQTPMAATCASGLCYIDQTTDTCVPAVLGTEDAVDLGASLATYGAPANATLDVSVVAGGLNDMNASTTFVQTGGLQLGFMGGTVAPTPSTCVPPGTWTPLPEPPPMNFDAEAALTGPGAALTGYDVGISLSSRYLNKSIFDAWQSGILCLNVSGDTISLLTSGLFSDVIANLNELDEGNDVPMLIALRPTKAPTILVGRGNLTLDSMGDLPDSLLTLGLPGLNIDFYAFLEEHYVRLFTLQADVSVPVSLDFDPTANTVTPVFEKQLLDFSNPKVMNNLMNADSDANLLNLFPALLMIAGPELQNLFSPIAIPTADGVQLQILGARGSITNPAGGYEHMALFADLSIPPAMMDTSGVHTEARLASSFVPASSHPIDASTQPHLTIDVSATGGQSTGFAGYEFQYRIDQKFWTAWTSETQLVLNEPILRFQGMHDVEVRARVRGQASTVDTVAAHITFPVDYEPPTVSLQLNGTGSVVTIAHDDVTPTGQISFRYNVSGSGWSAAGPSQDFDLSALGANPWLQVEASDLTGHTATATFGSPPESALAATATARLAAQRATPNAQSQATGGCAAVDPSLLGLLGLAALAWRRRTRRAR